MLKVTLSQEAASEAVDPAHRVPGVGNLGMDDHSRGSLSYPLTCGNVRTATRFAQSSPLPSAAGGFCPEANRAHPGFAMTLASGKPGFG